MQGEVSSADVEAAASYPEAPIRIIHEGAFMNQPSIFNVDETAFCWKMICLRLSKLKKTSKLQTTDSLVRYKL